jgi:mutator protein MutT
MKTVEVVAAIVEREGCYLVTRRPEGTHLAGLWEFPGGKVDDGESHEAALTREMNEELGVFVHVDGLVLTTSHAYPERTVTLHFYSCRIDGVPRPLLGQDVRWASRPELRTLPFPNADRALIQLLSAAR